MFPQLGMMEMIVVMGVAVLLFRQSRPPRGGSRSLGKGIIEFKKGLKGIEDEFDPQLDRVDLGARRRGGPRSGTCTRRAAASDYPGVLGPEVRAADRRARPADGIRAAAVAGLTRRGPDDGPDGRSHPDAPWFPR